MTGPTDVRKIDGELLPHPGGDGWVCPRCGEPDVAFYGFRPNRCCRSCLNRRDAAVEQNAPRRRIVVTPVITGDPPVWKGYLSAVPAAPSDVPDGLVVVHNHVRPTRRLGSRGFRAWFQAPGETLTVCQCSWAPELGAHYRVVDPQTCGEPGTARRAPATSPGPSSKRTGSNGTPTP